MESYFYQGELPFSWNPILLWSFFFGLILASIFILFNQLKERKWVHFFLLLIGFLVAFGITLLTPTASSNNLVYLFFSSMIAIIAMILPGISGRLSSSFSECMKKFCKPSRTVLLCFWTLVGQNFCDGLHQSCCDCLGYIYRVESIFSRIDVVVHQKEATLMCSSGSWWGIAKNMAVENNCRNSSKHQLDQCEPAWTRSRCAVRSGVFTFDMRRTKHDLDWTLCPKNDVISRAQLARSTAIGFQRNGDGHGQ